MFDPLIIVCALLCGMAFRSLGLPALLGYLSAGFILHEFGAQSGVFLAEVSELGVTLLLFSIGLKLQPAKLLERRIWGTAVVHMIAMQIMFSAALWLAVTLLPSLGLDTRAILVLGFALTFSSTVFVIQVMQERGESSSRHANLAIGILIIQDIAAILFLGFSLGKVPQPEALALLLLFPLRGVIIKLLSLCGHAELFTLFGLALAVGGSELFTAVGMKGDLGALVLGAILAGSQKAKELSKNLLYFKDLFLVGFFLSIGFSGFPGTAVLVVGILIGLLSLVKVPLYFLLMTRFDTQSRTAMLASLTLANYSEFGLIVLVVATQAGWIDNEWSAALSIAIAISFLISSSINLRAHQMYRSWSTYLSRFESQTVSALRPSLGDARIMVLGMGNIGTGAYSAMREHHGDCVVGVDDNDIKLKRHADEGRKVLAADASDPGFWTNINLQQLEVIMLALTNHEENKLVGKLLRERGYAGNLAAVVRFQEEEEELRAQGMSTFNLFAEAGRGFADHALEQLGHGALQTEKST